MSNPASRFVPVLSPRFPLDHLLLAYAQRLCRHALISVPEHRHNLNFATGTLPLWIDSGGYVLLSAPQATVHEAQTLGEIHRPGCAPLTPATVHAAQRHAHTAFTLDLPSPGSTPDHERQRRAALSFNNAQWALTQPRTGRLFASVAAGSDLAPYLALNPDGIALGGLAPHSRDREYLTRAVRDARAQMPAQLPLHVFGIGHPSSVRAVMAAGATTTDSSAPQRRAASGRDWTDAPALNDPAPHERLTLAARNLQTCVQAAGYL